MEQPKDAVFQPKTKKPKVDYSAPVVHSERQFPIDWMAGLSVEEHAKKLVPGVKVNIFWTDRKGKVDKAWYNWTVRDAAFLNCHGEWMVTCRESGPLLCVEQCQIVVDKS